MGEPAFVGVLKIRACRPFKHFSLPSMPIPTTQQFDQRYYFGARVLATIFNIVVDIERPKRTREALKEMKFRLDAELADMKLKRYLCRMYVLDRFLHRKKEEGEESASTSTADKMSRTQRRGSAVLRGLLSQTRRSSKGSRALLDRLIEVSDVDAAWEEFGALSDLLFQHFATKYSIAKGYLNDAWESKNGAEFCFWRRYVIELGFLLADQIDLRQLVIMYRLQHSDAEEEKRRLENEGDLVEELDAEVESVIERLRDLTPMDFEDSVDEGVGEMRGDDGEEDNESGGSEGSGGNDNTSRDGRGGGGGGGDRDGGDGERGVEPQGGNGQCSSSRPSSGRRQKRSRGRTASSDSDNGGVRGGEQDDGRHQRGGGRKQSRTSDKHHRKHSHRARDGRGGEAEMGSMNLDSTRADDDEDDDDDEREEDMHLEALERSLARADIETAGRVESFVLLRESNFDSSRTFTDRDDGERENGKHHRRSRKNRRDRRSRRGKGSVASEHAAGTKPSNSSGSSRGRSRSSSKGATRGGSADNLMHADQPASSANIDGGGRGRDGRGCGVGWTMGRDDDETPTPRASRRGSRAAGAHYRFGADAGDLGASGSSAATVRHTGGDGGMRREGENEEQEKGHDASTSTAAASKGKNEQHVSGGGHTVSPQSGMGEGDEGEDEFVDAHSSLHASVATAAEAQGGALRDGGEGEGGGVRSRGLSHHLGQMSIV